MSKETKRTATETIRRISIEEFMSTGEEVIYKDEDIVAIKSLPISRTSDNRTRLDCFLRL